MNENLDAFSKEIYEISREEFSIINFEALISKIRNDVSEVNYLGVLLSFGVLKQHAFIRQTFFFKCCSTKVKSKTQ